MVDFAIDFVRAALLGTAAFAVLAGAGLLFVERVMLPYAARQLRQHFGVSLRNHAEGL